MKTSRVCDIFTVVMAFAAGFGLTHDVRAAEPSSGSAENVALHRPYTFSTPPSYKLCTDPGDATQLTDGESRGADWRETSTVGWTREDKPPYVVIDLGTVQPIDAVRVHSVGGGKASVFYPSNMAVLVSDDGATFHLVGAADNLGLAQNRVDSIAAERIPHVFRMDGLATRGRFVMVLFDFDGDHLFVDEIAVLRGAHEADPVRFSATNAYSIADVPAVLQLAREFAEARFAIERWSRAKSADQLETARIVATQRDELHTVPMHDMDALRAFEDRVGRARGKWLGSLTGRRVIWERVNPMVQARPFDLPDGPGESESDDRRRIDVAAWQGEYESAAVSLFNCGDTPLSLRPTLTPLRAPSGDMLPASDTISLRHAVFVDARGEGRIGDALVKIPEGGFRIEPGRAGQLWLTFHNPRLEPGAYHFAVDLDIHDDDAPATSSHEMIQGSLTVHPIRFPERPALNSYAWAFVERTDLTKDVPEEAVADLRAHYIDTDVLFWSRCLPMPRVNVDGQVEMRLNELLDSLARYKNNDLYMFYWGLGRYRKNVPNFPDVGTPAWRDAIKQWLTKWTAFLKEQGVGYDRFVMYPFDEMIPDEFLTLARFIKEEVDPRIRLFANSRGDNDATEMARIAPYIDVWCFRDVPYRARLGATEQRVRREASAVWCYDCARPAKGKPPHGYYRLQMWRAFDRGETGCGFWTYSDPGEGQGDAWDDFAGVQGKYGVIYGPIGKPPRVDLCGEHIAPSRRWEAWREGVEDFEYLTQLRKAIEASQRAGQRMEAVEAQTVLDQAVRAVLENEGNPNRSYEARRKITEQILRLRRDDRSGTTGS